MSEPNPTGLGPQEADRRAVNAMRSAGSATLAAGGLLIVFTMASLVLELGGREPLVLGSHLAIGVLLVFLGGMTFRMRTWGAWAAMAIGLIFVAAQLWEILRGPEGVRQPVFLLIIPLLVLVLNTLAVSAAHRPRPKP